MTSPRELILQNLENVREVGPYKWSAKCLCHDSKSGSSLRIRELDDGRILLHDFGGCSVGEILGALGLEFSDLYPKTADYHLPKVRKPWNAGDVLNALAFEVLVAVQYANAMAAGEVLGETARARLVACASRLQSGLGVVNG